MRHLVMDAANSWPTWAAFLGAAWGGLILVAAVIVRRIGRALAPTPSLDAEVAHAADDAVPYWPTDPDAEWDRLVQAIKEDW